MRRRYKFRLSTIDYRLLTSKGGQSLIEVLVAFAVSVLIGIALITASLATQKASISARNGSQGTKLAQEYLEQIRVIRDVKGYNTTTFAINGCRIIDNSSNNDPTLWNIVSTNPSNPLCPPGEKIPLNKTDFYRKIAISAGPSANSVQVVVSVTWAEGTNTKTVTAQTVISQWCTTNITGSNSSDCGT